MASNTPRQRQIHAAVTAQLHNLSVNLQGTLLAPAAAEALPAGWAAFPDRVPGPVSAAQSGQPSVNLAPTLYNEGANRPPEGRAQRPDRFWGRPPVVQLELPAPNYAPLREFPPGQRAQPDRLFTVPRAIVLGEPSGTLTALYGTPLPGRASVPERVPGPAPARIVAVDRNLLPTLHNLAANVPPVGQHADLDRWRQAVVPQGVAVAQLHNLSVNRAQLFAEVPQALPDGKALLWDRERHAVSAAQTGQPGTNLQETLYNEAANVPPEGGRAQPDRAARQGAARQPDPIVNVTPLTADVSVPGKVLLWERRDARALGAWLQTLTADLQATLYEAPPVGRAIDWQPPRTPEAVNRRLAQQHNLAENRQPNLYNLAANLLPPGVSLARDVPWQAFARPWSVYAGNRTLTAGGPIILDTLPERYWHHQSGTQGIAGISGSVGIRATDTTTIALRTDDP